jgi:3-hydroxyisobutyrate dehydrogenase-like beta-hydroxyacid dehydrogenase
MSGAITRVALIGFGEAGGVFGEALVKRGVAVSAYDILVQAPDSRPALLQKAARAGVTCRTSLHGAVESAELVISAVTAGSSSEVAQAAAGVLTAGQAYLDINSVSPATKLANSRLIEVSGADFIEAAVMAPVVPQALEVPMLLGGPRAAGWLAALRGLGLNARVIDERVGIASAVKMCRSILIKGLEALTLESLSAARRFGAEQAVLASLHHSFPHMGWDAVLPDYLISRVAEHGRRRAAEMREVASTLEAVGVEPVMARATAERQQDLVDEMARRGLRYAGEGFSWRALSDALATPPARREDAP